MCLDNGHKARKLKSTMMMSGQRVEVWYKVVENRRSKKRLFYTTPYRYSKVELMKPYKNHMKREIGYTSDSWSKYKLGYHFYSLSAAREMRGNNGLYNNYTILECLVFNPHIHGKDRYGRACVADEFIAIKEVK